MFFFPITEMSKSNYHYMFHVHAIVFNFSLFITFISIKTPYSFRNDGLLKGTRIKKIIENGGLVAKTGQLRSHSNNIELVTSI